MEGQAALIFILTRLDQIKFWMKPFPHILWLNIEQSLVLAHNLFNCLLANL